MDIKRLNKQSKCVKCETDIPRRDRRYLSVRGDLCLSCGKVLSAQITINRELNRADNRVK